MSKDYSTLKFFAQTFSGETAEKLSKGFNYVANKYNSTASEENQVELQDVESGPSSTLDDAATGIGIAYAVLGLVTSATDFFTAGHCVMIQTTPTCGAGGLFPGWLQ